MLAIISNQGLSTSCAIEEEVAIHSLSKVHPGLTLQSWLETRARILMSTNTTTRIKLKFALTRARYAALRKPQHSISARPARHPALFYPEIKPDIDLDLSRIRPISIVIPSSTWPPHSRHRGCNREHSVSSGFKKIKIFIVTSSSMGVILR